METILETDRLLLRKLTQADMDSLKRTLQDPIAMTYYEGAFSEEECQAWLKRMLERYEKEGIGLWAVIRKDTQEFIGQCGLTWQDWKGKKVLEVGYLFEPRFWHQGFATEAARGCMDYAFEKMNVSEICSIIRDTNLTSQKVALRNGLQPADHFTKFYRGVHMPHTRYVLSRADRTVRQSLPEPDREEK